MTGTRAVGWMIGQQKDTVPHTYRPTFQRAPEPAYARRDKDSMTIPDVGHKTGYGSQ